MEWLKRVIGGFQFAGKGIWFALTTERNFQIHAVAAVIVTILGCLVPLTALEWAVIALTMGLVTGLELINTSIEKLCDHTHGTENHPQIALIKDLAAAGVLMGAIAAVAVGIILILIPLVKRTFL